MKVHIDQWVRKPSYTLKVPCIVLYGFQPVCMKDISPQIDLMYSCLLEDDLCNLLKNRIFLEVQSEFLVLSGKNHVRKSQSSSSSATAIALINSSVSRQSLTAS
jgi:hypothetical protein